METNAVQSDKGLGISLALGLLAAGGAASMLVLPGQVNRALAFALAMVAASIAVTAIHLFA